MTTARAFVLEVRKFPDCGDQPTGALALAATRGSEVEPDQAVEPRAGQSPARADGAWARNLLMDLGECVGGFRFLVRDRARQFTEAFDAVQSAAEIKVVKILPRRANAYAERRVRTARADRMLITGPRHLRAVLDEYVMHYKQYCPYRARNLRPPDHAGNITTPVTDLARARIRRHKVRGG